MFDDKNANLCLVEKSGNYELMDYTQLQYCKIASFFINATSEITDNPILKTDNSKLGFFTKINNHAKIIIGKEFDLPIFRGQNKSYSLIPSICRLNEIYHCIKCVKKENFKIIFKLTPYFKILSKMSILGTYFEFDLEAIAQHYGFATKYLDITTDKQVALFFAYTYCKNGKYYPITDFTDYQPTLYQDTALEYGNPNSLIPIGFQAVLRPQRQKAMAIDMTIKTISHLTKTDLPKDVKKAQEIYEYFNGGDDLFPKDELINQIAHKIKESKTLDEKLFLRYCRHFHKDKKIVKEQLNKLGYQIKYCDEYHINKEIISKMECETYNIIIPWTKENIFYRKAHTKTEAFYVNAMPQYLI